MDFTSEDYQLIGAVIFIVIILLIILREFFCWHFKINQRYKEQQITNIYLKEIISHMKVESGKKHGDPEQPLAKRTRI